MSWVVIGGWERGFPIVVEGWSDEIDLPTTEYNPSGSITPLHSSTPSLSLISNGTDFFGRIFLVVQQTGEQIPVSGVWLFRSEQIYGNNIYNMTSGYATADEYGRVVKSLDISGTISSLYDPIGDTGFIGVWGEQGARATSYLKLNYKMKTRT